MADFIFGGIWISLQEWNHAHQDSRCAITALQTVCFPKGLLKRMQIIFIRSKSLDGCNFMSIGLDGEGQTRSRRFSIEHDRASAADSVFATNVRASESKFVAQKVAEQHAWLDGAGIFLSIDSEGDGVSHNDQFSTSLILSLLRALYRDLQRLHRQRLRQMTLKLHRSMDISKRGNFFFTRM